MNSMILFGLAVALGITIDDAVVVRENTLRHLELGRDPRSAGRLAVAEIRGPLSSATFAILAGFVALALTAGSNGQGLRLFALTAALAILVSAVVALTLDGARTAGRLRYPFFPFDRWFARFEDRYHDALAWALNHRAAMGLLLLSPLLLIVGSRVLPGRTELFASSSETREITLELRGPDGTTLAGVARRIADQVRQVPGIAGLVFVTSRDTLGQAPGERVETLRVALRGPLPLVARKIDAGLDTVPLPPGYQVRRSQDETTPALPASLPGALGLGLAVLYLVLVLRFGSFRDPLGILLGLPLAGVGGLGALVLTGRWVTLPALLGLLLVLGIAVRHGTLLLTCARRRHARGASLRVALIDSGRVRFRPVLLSTTVLVVAALGLSVAGSEGFRSFGIAVLGGVLSSALTTLLVTPAGYELLARSQSREPVADLS